MYPVDEKPWRGFDISKQSRNRTVERYLWGILRTQGPLFVFERDLADFGMDSYIKIIDDPVRMSTILEAAKREQ
jgi:hypothetical protein